MKNYDLQVHTEASPCSNAPPEAIVRAAADAGLDGIAITDHDTMENIVQARNAAPPELKIIPGVEITTSEGHLLAYNIDEIPDVSTPIEVADAIHAQGGISALSHPFDTLREHYAPRQELFEAVNAIEVINSRCLFPCFNKQARKIAESAGLAMIAGSDAHFPMEVGRARTRCRVQCLDAIKDHETTVEGRGGYISGHIATKILQARRRLHGKG